MQTNRPCGARGPRSPVVIGVLAWTTPNLEWRRALPYKAVAYSLAKGVMACFADGREQVAEPVRWIQTN
jgi:hypothetical protein